MPVKGPWPRKKWNAKRIVVDGTTFDSMAEAYRYSELKWLRDDGQIAGLKVHVTYPIEINGEVVCRYIADFVYIDEMGELVIEDVKSPVSRTDVYRLKKKLMRVVNGLEVREIETKRRKR